MEEIASEILGNIEKTFAESIEKNAKILEIYAKIKTESATYEQANEFAIKAGEVLADAYEKNISKDDLPDGRMHREIAEAILNPTLKNDHDLIAAVTTEIQDCLNKSAHVGIKAIEPELNQDRIDGIIKKVSSYENFDDAKWILNEPVKTFSQSVVDDAIRKNAEFHSESGLRPKIARKIAGSCCEWCANLAGTYRYPDDVPDDVYKRHQRCRCTINYDPGDGKTRNIYRKTKKSKRAISDVDYMGQPKVYKTNLGKNSYAIKTYKNDKYKNIWCQTNSDNSQKMCKYLNNVVSKKYPGVKEIVVAKRNALRGVAAYDHKKKIFYISEELIDEEKFKKNVDSVFFASKSLDDVLVHELGGHKKHWEAVERYCEVNNCNTLEDAKRELESELREYIVRQINNEPSYLRKNISENANQKFLAGDGLNESIADAIVLIERNDMQDPNLEKKILEVIDYDDKTDKGRK